MSVRIINGDCIAEMPKLAAAGERFHACVTDPPYGLEFVGKEWDAPWQSGAGFSKPGIGVRKTAWPAFTSGSDEFGGANPTCATCGGRARGKKKCACAEPDWRVKGAAPDRDYGRHRQMQTFQSWCEAWARAAFECLLPGAYLLAFGGTRTHHRLVCAIEDAGFEIRDTICWLYGSGFPKSHDVERGVDMTLCERPGRHYANRIPEPDKRQPNDHVCPSCDQGDEWEGFGTALKPAHEPIIVARKPLQGTVAANVLRHGCGAINVDASRIESEPVITTNGACHGMMSDDAWDNAKFKGQSWEMPAAGRWPANVIHDGSDEVLAAFPDAPGQLFAHKDAQRSQVNVYGATSDGGKEYQPRGDSGSAARFFYSAKADASDRQGSKHPTVKPTDLMRYLVRLVTPPGGTVLDPFAGTGSTGLAADQLGFNAVLIEQDATYAEDARRKLIRDAGLFAEVAYCPRALVAAQ